ncbi:hypothetical protein CABS01_04440 [Colletotrichum abscissum]|uniref:Uncharacterized protein n=1 Tax=Colletotrichum abscissum TaxID=1671311 RepID=A0A9P9XLZ4_9PEZI|nr:uncharacterized protein CABS01_04440 [Colletotrichum abscissum]KAI3556304.1 hypothetical protein CABS02_03587 [Colletotrichum abscissum]KAK1473778.1 hypothetical protein CABS01_04440 [Colletotrichum abscissum]
MPGLTIQTDAISPRTSSAPAPAPSTSAAAGPTAATTSSAGGTNPPHAQQTPPRSSRSSSPARPPISPITPTLPPARLPDPPAPFAADRPVLTHSSQPSAATAIPPPRPEPIDFDSNPDVLALKSAISILQMQSRKAAADIQGLNAAKNAAVENPSAFLADLGTGKVHTQGDKLFAESDSDSDDETEGKADGSAAQGKAKEPPQPWESLPKPQNVVRCPPINWSQYAVVGESLDKIHADQLARPSQGAPATLGPSGTYEFKGEPGGNQRPFIGVAAPYTPGKDRIEKKARGSKR